jgi:hypothetical protein
MPASNCRFGMFAAGFHYTPPPQPIILSGCLPALRFARGSREPAGVEELKKRPPASDALAPAIQMHASSFRHVCDCVAHYSPAMPKCMRFLLERSTDIADAPARHQQVVIGIGRVESDFCNPPASYGC